MIRPTPHLEFGHARRFQRSDRMLYRLVSTTLLFGIAIHSHANALPCSPLGMDKTQIRELQQAKFSTLNSKQTQKLALALAACLGDLDPIWRDDIAFASLSSWMRADALELKTRRKLLTDLQVILTNTPSEQYRFQQAFAALVLAEVARTHRIKAWLTPDELDTLVTVGTRFLRQIRDYRGYSDQQGWQHALAHSADLMLQLSLLTDLQTVHLQEVADAIASQVPAHDGHSYVYGEAERLAAPIYYLSQRKFLSSEQWRTWFAKLVIPPEGINKDNVFRSEKTLAWRHNVQFFLLCALANAQQLPDPALKQTQVELISAALKALP